MHLAQCCAKVMIDDPFNLYSFKLLQEFQANTVEGSSMFESINTTICRFVRIYPLSWSGKVALRVELYGYEAGKEIKGSALVFRII